MPNENSDTADSEQNWKQLQQDLTGLQTLHQMELDLIRRIEQAVEQLKQHYQIGG